MKTLYAACLSRLGLSQAEAAALHDVSLQSVKNWCAGRSSPPTGIWDELRAVEAQIVDFSEAMRERWEAAGSPPIEIDDSEGDYLARIGVADLVLNTTGPVSVGQTPATMLARQARRPK